MMSQFVLVLKMTITQTCPLLVRMRCLFFFSSRVGHLRQPLKDVPSQPDSPPNKCISHKNSYPLVQCLIDILL